MYFMWHDVFCCGLVMCCCKLLLVNLRLEDKLHKFQYINHQGTWLFYYMEKNELTWLLWYSHTQTRTHAHTYTLKWITFFFLKTLRLFTAKQFWATYWGQPVRSLCCCTFDGWSFICLTEMGCEVFVSSCVHGWNRPPLWLTDAEES